MISKFSIELPLCPTSMGQMATGILAEFQARDLYPNIFPIGKVDLSQFQAPPNFMEWLETCVRKAPGKFKREDPSIKYFHTNGSHSAIGDKSRLYTVFETDSLTPVEKNLLRRHDSVMVPSTYNQKVMKECGIEAAVCQNYFDSRHIFKRDVIKEDYITWGLIGKTEYRKRTAPILKAWIKRFGGNKDHRLNLHVINVFLCDRVPREKWVEFHRMSLQQTIGIEIPWNCQFFDFLNQNEHIDQSGAKHENQLNQAYNVIDIDLSGLSGAEGCNLPFLNTRCLGKRGVSLNAHSHTDYADAENSVLVEPSGKCEIKDEMFYNKKNPFNHGQMFAWEEDAAIAGMEEALARPEPDQKKAAALANKYSVANTVNSLLSEF